MKTLVRAVITGFGLALGKMIFEKVHEKYGDYRSRSSVDIVDADLVDDDDTDGDSDGEARPA